MFLCLFDQSPVDFVFGESFTKEDPIFVNSLRLCRACVFTLCFDSCLTTSYGKIEQFGLVGQPAELPRHRGRSTEEEKSPQNPGSRGTASISSPHGFVHP